MKETIIKLSTFFAIFAFCELALAQDASAPLIKTNADSQSPERVRAGEQKKDMDVVIVSAQKRDEQLQEVPVPVSVINTDALSASNQARLQDYYTKVPGLQITPAGNYTWMAIRGVTTGGGQNPTVGIMIDDAPYGASTHLGGGNAIPEIDPGDLARIEVLRGPQGTLYGANSMGGLLKFVTTDPSTDRLSGRIEAGSSSIRNGSEAGYQFRGSVNVPAGDKLAVSASGFTRKIPGYIDNPVLGIDGVNEEHMDGGRIAALWRPSDTVSLKVSALYQESTADGGRNNLSFPNLGDLQQNFRPYTGEYEREVQAYSGVIKAALGKAELTAVSGYMINTQSDSYDWDYAIAPLMGLAGFPGRGGDLASVNRAKKFTQEIRIASTFGAKMEWMLGAYYADETSTYRQSVLAVIPATDATVGTALELNFPTSLTEYAAFGNATYHFTDKFDVQIGARGSFMRQTLAETETGPLTPIFAGVPSPLIVPKASEKSDAFTYLLTPRFKLTPDIMAYARLASGYRVGAPNLSPGANVPLKNEPDKTVNYELGIKGEFFDRAVSLDASLYYIDWSHIQLAGNNPATRLLYAFNGNDAKSQGVEFSVGVRPLNGLSVAVWTAWMDAKLTEDAPPPPTGGLAVGIAGARLPFGSRFSGNFSLDQEFSLGDTWKGFVGGSVSYIGKRVGAFRPAGLARQAYPSYAKADLTAGMRNGSWAVTIYANNVADRRGFISGGLDLGLNPPAYVYIQPRTLGLTLAKTFQ